ncbi:MAG: TonB-dependent receptor domain-containing protein [Flavobacteriaceae bacterium]
MKHTIRVFFALLLIYTTSAFAQKGEFKISGKVVDKETNQALEYATIVLKEEASGKVSGGITTVTGDFSINTKKGIYEISIEFLGFKPVVFKNKTVSSDINLGTISLATDENNLEAVEIIAEKSTVEIRLDKKIYNVGKDMTVKGGTAADVLANVPSVTVDIEGAVSLRGNENVRILINGKPSTFASGADALKQLPADAIQKVEVITSPSARYDAEGTAGILNIVLRKGKALGFNGSFTLNTGIPTNFGASTNLNYRTNKVNYFTTIGYNYNDAPGNAYFENEYLQNNPSGRFQIENRLYDRERKNFNSRFGLEYFLTDNASLTGSMLYRNSDRATNTGTNTSTRDINYNEEAYKNRNELEDESDEQIEFNLNFTQNFKTSGHKLTFDFKYEDSKDDELATITGRQTFPSITNDPIEKTSNLEDQKRYLFQGDYVLPIGENAQFEAGFRSNMSNQETDYVLLEEQPSGEFEVNQNVSNLFIYDEHVHALYSQYGNKYGKFSALFGLRMEISNITVKVFGTDLDAKKRYTELFPTLNLAYELNEDETLTLGYNRRVRRPRSWFINPFPSRASENNIFQGNPDLDPAYSNGVDLGYLKKWDKLTFNTSVYYNYSTDVFQFVRSADATDPTITRTTPKNISSEDRFGLEFSLNYSPFKWWKLNSNFNFFRITADGKNIVPNSETNSWSTRLNSRVKLPAKIDWQTTFNYRGPQENFQSKRKGIASVNLAFSKDILKDNGTLSLNVSDLFNSRKRISDTFIDGVTNSYSEFQWRERQIRLNFTYRLNQKKKRNQNQHNDNGGSEGGF